MDSTGYATDSMQHHVLVFPTFHASVVSVLGPAEPVQEGLDLL